jgi:hypothetical protein
MSNSQKVQKSTEQQDARSQKQQEGSENYHPLTSQIVQRAHLHPHLLTAGDVLQLQRTVGNQATIRLLQPVLQAKMKVGPVGDRFEQEADRIAEQVVQKVDSPSVAQRTPPEEEELQMKPLVSPLLTWHSSANARPAKSIQSLQRAPLLHGSEGGDVDQNVASQIQAARGGGKLLNKNVRRQMEQGFGTDFSKVNIHTTTEADTLNRSLNARAFTVGSDVFFRSGEYNPESSNGQQLLPHELTHTIQQRNSSIQRTEESVVSGQQQEPIIQRQIEPIGGKSSGWFRKGRRDNLNAKVAAYNTLEARLTGPKRNTVQSAQLLHSKVEEILRDAERWCQSVTKTPDKEQEIRSWIQSQVVPERDAKQNALSALQEATRLENAWKNPIYNPLYTSSEYKGSNGGIVWLSTPELAPIYKYYVIKVQFDAPTVNAYEDIQNYKKNPSRDEALRVFDKYNMSTSSDLNITGEGVGGIAAINAVRTEIEKLRSNAPDAVVPRDFGAIEMSVVNVLNEIFGAFTSTEQFKKVTTPPT